MSVNPPEFCGSVAPAGGGLGLRREDEEAVGVAPARSRLESASKPSRVNYNSAQMLIDKLAVKIHGNSKSLRFN